MLPQIINNKKYGVNNHNLIVTFEPLITHFYTFPHDISQFLLCNFYFQDLVQSTLTLTKDKTFIQTLIKVLFTHLSLTFNQSHTKTHTNEHTFEAVHENGSKVAL